MREFNSQHSPIIAGELFLPELFLPEETADQLIIDGKIGSAGYMIQHPCGIASYQGKSSRAQRLCAWPRLVEQPPEAFRCLMNNSVVAIMFCSVRVGGLIPIV